MENRINQVMTLEDGKKYAVIKQAIYKEIPYYVVIGIDSDGETLLEDYNILREIDYEGNKCVEKVEEPEIFKLVSEYLGLVNKEDWK